MTKKTNTLIAVAAAIVLLPGLLTACSGGPDSDPTSSKGTGAKGQSLGECMREKGYDMPDAEFGSDSMQFTAPDGVDKEQYQADLSTCLDSALGDGAGEAGMAKEIPGGDEKQAKLSKCIRDNGFSDYPDSEKARMDYRPDDEKAFREVENRCAEKAFGTGSTSTNDDAPGADEQ